MSDGLWTLQCSTVEDLVACLSRWPADAPVRLLDGGLHINGVPMCERVGGPYPSTSGCLLVKMPNRPHRRHFSAAKALCKDVRRGDNA
jgi:hypothetical protein